jgi:hypothetical protein
MYEEKASEIHEPLRMNLRDALRNPFEHLKAGL